MFGSSKVGQRPREKSENPAIEIATLGSTIGIDADTKKATASEKQNVAFKFVPPKLSCSFHVVLSIGLYLSFGPFLIMLNKHILRDLNYNYPIMVSSLGMLTSSIIVHTLVFFKFITIRPQIRNIVTMRFFVQRIGIIGFLQACTLNFGNGVYMYLSVSLIQMLKAFTPVMILCLQFGVGLLKPSIKYTIAIVALSLGTSVTSFNVPEEDNSPKGFLWLFLAEFIEACKLILSQRLLQSNIVASSQTSSSTHSNRDNRNESEQESLMDKKESIAEAKPAAVKFQLFEALYYFSPAAFFWMMVLVIPFELPHFTKYWDMNIATLSVNWYKFVVQGLLGFGCNVAAWMVTGVISGLYLKALGTIRNTGLVLVNVVFFHEIVTTQELMGYFISLTGFAYYNYLLTQN